MGSNGHDHSGEIDSDAAPCNFEEPWIIRTE